MHVSHHCMRHIFLLNNRRRCLGRRDYLGPLVQSVVRMCVRMTRRRHHHSMWMAGNIHCLSHSTWRHLGSVRMRGNLAMHSVWRRHRGHLWNGTNSTNWRVIGHVTSGWKMRSLGSLLKMVVWMSLWMVLIRVVSWGWVTWTGTKSRRAWWRNALANRIFSSPWFKNCNHWRFTCSVGGVDHWLYNSPPRIDKPTTRNKSTGMLGGKKIHYH